MQSPRLRRLQNALAEDDTALVAFWREIESQGTPLIEAIPADETHSIVTFLWRATEPVETAAVVSDLPEDPAGSPVDAMVRLPRTNLWYRSYRLRNDLRTTYELSPNDPLTPIRLMDNPSERTATFQVDPMNPRRYRVNLPSDRWEGSPEKFLSVLELPDAPPQPYVERRPTVARGTVTLHRLRSKMLKNERRIWVHMPPGYGTEQAPPGLLVLFDGAAYLELMHAATSLDNLYAGGQIPPLVTVFVDNVGPTSRFTELACDEDFLRFLVLELLPWVRREYRVTDDPSRCVVGGTSLGGLAAAFAGFRHPETFGNVLSQSGAFGWSPTGQSELGWFIRQMETSPQRPLRFYLDAGLLEQRIWQPGWPSLLDTNRMLRDVLIEKGYAVTYLEFNGAHNYICWQGTLADGLIALMAAAA